MSKSEISAEELIQAVFAPMVAVLSSPDVEEICQKNKLNFVEIMRPFCKLKVEVQVKDAGGISHSVSNLEITMRDMNLQPPNPALARKTLNDAVTYAAPKDATSEQVISVGNNDLQLSSCTPWYEAYRNQFLQVAYQSDHEFLKHFIACIFVVSSSHSDPLGQLSKLVQQQHSQQHNHPNKLPMWFCPNIYHYFVLLHDVSVADISRTESLYQTMKTSHGTSSCHLLQINSSSSSDTAVLWPDLLNHLVMTGEQSLLSPLETEQDENGLEHPLAEGHFPDDLSPLLTSSSTGLKRGACLSSSDHDRLSLFVQEFCVRGLIPWAERTMRNLSEQINSRKRTGTFIKKWFSSGRQSVPSTPSERANVVYTSDAPEMQLRRLGDLAFMFHLYDLAHNSYHCAKKDFSNEQAWLYYAGAQEMTALSAFLLDRMAQQRQYPQSYMEEAINTYLTTCNMPQFATRATLICAEILKSKNLFAEAAMQFIKMTSEDSDLRSALLLEQAAHCYLNISEPLVRKYAFHMILAGHRFSKAGQRRHALRSYAQALQVYKGKFWTLAEDHIHFTMGRQSFNLKQLENAAASFKHLLSANSRQPAPQQSVFLREYLFVYKQLLSLSPSTSALPQLPLPLVDANKTRVLLSVSSDFVDTPIAPGMVFPLDYTIKDADLSVDEDHHLEALLVEFCNKGVSGLLKPSVSCYTQNTNNSQSPIIPVHEPLIVEVWLQNPLQISLQLQDIFLLWSFLPANSNKGSSKVAYNNECKEGSCSADCGLVQTQVMKHITFSAKEHKKVCLCLVPCTIGDLHITGVAYQLSAMTQSNPVDSMALAIESGNIAVQGKVNLEVTGPRLNSTMEEKAGHCYGPDRRLDVDVFPSMPKLKVAMSHTLCSILCGEVRCLTLYLKNTGPIALTSVFLSSSHPRCFTFDDSLPPGDPYRINQCETRTHSVPYSCSEKLVQVLRVPLPDDGTVLTPNQEVQLPIWVIGPDSPGPHNILFMFYYEVVSEPAAPMKHRVVRHQLSLDVVPSVGVKAAVDRRVSKTTGSSPIGDSLSIQLQLTNLNQLDDSSITELSILQVSAACPSWSLSSEFSSVPYELKVSSSESLLLSLNANKIAAVDDHICFSNVCWEKNQIESWSCPAKNFFLKHRQRLPDAEVPEKSAGKSFPELDCSQSVDFSLIAFWKAYIVDESGSSRIVWGQKQLDIVQLHKIFEIPATFLNPFQEVCFSKSSGVESAALPSPTILCRLVDLQFICPKSVYHNFGSNRLCLFPVEVVLVNRSREILLVNIQSNLPSAACDAPVSNCPVSRHLWVGFSGLNCTLASEGRFSFKLVACFTVPAVYDLCTSLSISVRPADKSWQSHEQLLTSQAFLTVHGKENEILTT